MWTYSTNCMGPYGLWWYEKNNIPYTSTIMNNQWTKFEDVEYKNYEHWYGGRIDCRCSDTSDKDYDHYGRELGLKIMDGESYAKFSDWLFDYTTEKLAKEEELYDTFQRETGHKIRFFEKGMYK